MSGCIYQRVRVVFEPYGLLDEEKLVNGSETSTFSRGKAVIDPFYKFAISQLGIFFLQLNTYKFTNTNIFKNIAQQLTGIISLRYLGFFYFFKSLTYFFLVFQSIFFQYQISISIVVNYQSFQLLLKIAFTITQVGIAKATEQVFGVHEQVLIVDATMSFQFIKIITLSGKKKLFCRIYNYNQIPRECKLQEFCK